jgi:hypothetical protein
MARRGAKIKRPAVVGAIIDLGDCLDLMTQVGVDMVRAAYRSLSAMLAGAGEVMPRNQDRLRRQLDCAVIRHLHAIYDHQGDRLDSVRGVFVEGREVYPGSGFDEKTHIQIAVRNPDCIKGVFRVPDAHLRHWAPDQAGSNDRM